MFYHCSIDALIDFQLSSAAILNKSIVTQFWIEFLTELFRIIIKSRYKTHSSELWIFTAIHIVGYHPNQNQSIVSSFTIIDLILHLLDTIPDGTNHLSNSLMNSDCQIISSNNAITSTKSTYSIFQHLLYQLSCYSDTEERLITAVLQCFDSSIVSTLSEQLSNEKIGTVSGNFGIVSSASTMVPPDKRVADAKSTILGGTTGDSVLFPILMRSITDSIEVQSDIKLSSGISTNHKYPEFGPRYNEESTGTNSDQFPFQLLSRGLQLDEDRIQIGSTTITGPLS